MSNEPQSTEGSDHVPKRLTPEAMKAKYNFQYSGFGKRRWKWWLLGFLIFSLALCIMIPLYIPDSSPNSNQTDIYTFKTSTKDFYSKICIPLIAACATFCITLSGRITTTSDRIRKLSDLFFATIAGEANADDQSTKAHPNPTSLLRCSAIMKQINELQDRYLISRVSFASKVFGILAFISMEFFAYTDNFWGAKWWLYAGLSMLITGFFISIYDVFSGHLSLRRELEYIDYKYGIFLDEFFEDDCELKEWLDSRFDARTIIHKRLEDRFK